MATAISDWERLFWHLFEESVNPITLLDDHRRIIEINQPAVAMLRRGRGELLGSSIVDTIRPEERAQAARDWQTFLRDGHHDGERTLLRGDGTTVQIEFSARMAVVDGRRLGLYVLMPPMEPLAPAEDLPAGSLLTPRECEVVTLIALGRDTAAIADELHIAPETVRTHVRNAMARLGAHTRAQLVALTLLRPDALRLPRTED